MNQALEVLDFDDPAPLLPEDAEPIQQGSLEWLALRAGKVSASRLSDVMAKGQGVTRDKYKCKLAAERLTGKPIETEFTNPAMKRGTELEPEARDLYSLLYDVDVAEVAIVPHPTIANALCSPDGMVDKDGLVEIKCPDLSTHIGYLLDRKIPRNYHLQMMWQMACTGMAWCDWVSYCPELPPKLKMLCIRLHRDEGEIKVLEQAVIQFDKEVEGLCEKLGKI